MSDVDDMQQYPVNVGRLMLGQHVCGIFATPKGLVIAVPRVALNDGHLVFVESYSDSVLAGFGKDKQ